MTGQTISHYRIAEKLGQGGMGVVYKAEDINLNRPVAIKFLAPGLLESEEHKKRFVREAKVAALLDHPNVCTIFEAGEADGHAFVAMGFVDGQDLRAKILERPLKLDEALDIAIQAAEGLKAAHEKGVVHRDINGGNLMVTRTGQLKITDFGLAHFAATTKLTKTDTIMGTPAYMSPEQAQGLETDHRTDIWSLGVVLYEMVTARLPFAGGHALAVTHSIINEGFEPITSLRASVPLELDRIVLKALAKQPSERYQHMDDLLVDLRALLGQASSSIAAPRAGLRNRRGRRVRWWLIAACALAVLAVAAVLGTKLWTTASPERIESVAVLPFENLSNDLEQAYFVDGMTDQLITSLSKIRTLRVISRTSSAKYRNKGEKLLPQIARELGVQAVVEGSVMRSAGKVRVTVQLIRAQDERNLWAESYQRDLTEVIELQNELAQTIGSRVSATVSNEDRSRLAPARRVEPEVNDLVLRGHYFANKFTVPDLRKAIGYFEQAAKKDPIHAPAYAGIAFAYRSLSVAQEAPHEVMPNAKAAAERALELDETLADAHVSLAYVLLFYEWDGSETEKHAKRALALNPSSAQAHLLLAAYFRAVGEPGKAMAETRLALALDPLSLPVQSNLLFNLLVARQYDEVVEQSRHILAREPRFVFAHVFSALAYAEDGQAGRGIQEIEKAARIENSPFVKVTSAHVYGAGGNKSKALTLLDEVIALRRERYVCPYEIAHAYLKVGDRNQTYEWLEKGVTERADCMIWLRAEPWMDALRGDRRYKKLIEQVGLVASQPVRNSY